VLTCYGYDISSVQKYEQVEEKIANLWELEWSWCMQ